MPARSIRRLLAPIDFSQPATEALAYAREVFAGSLEKIWLVHALDSTDFLPTGPIALPIPATELERRVREGAEERLDEMVEELAGAGVAAAAVVRPGYPHRVIAEVAEAEKIDLIVMATHGRRGIERFLLGSVAEKVVRSAPCPVLTVRPASGSG